MENKVQNEERELTTEELKRNNAQLVNYCQQYETRIQFMQAELNKQKASYNKLVEALYIINQDVEASKKDDGNGKE